jgi:hypothetical protein
MQEGQIIQTVARRVLGVSGVRTMPVESIPKGLLLHVGFLIEPPQETLME